MSGQFQSLAKGSFRASHLAMPEAGGDQEVATRW